MSMSLIQSPTFNESGVPFSGEQQMATTTTSSQAKSQTTALANDVVLRTENLDFYYGPEQALHDFSISIKKGKVTALIGASGSGKSTVLRTFNQIYRLYPEQYATGTILFHEQNLLEPGLDVSQLRKYIGMVFQKPAPFPLSIFDNIAFAIKLHEKLSSSELSNRVEAALKQAALWDEVKDKLKAQASRLSGGQQQRLCIARTIATQPEILLLDEPTSALDPKSARQIEDLIATLAQYTTIVMVTHNLKQARRSSNYTAFLHQGRLVEMAPTQQLFERPEHELTHDYVLGKHHEEH